jgi:hypothetical protein
MAKVHVAYLGDCDGGLTALSVHRTCAAAKAALQNIVVPLYDLDESVTAEQIFAQLAEERLAFVDEYELHGEVA